MPYVPRLLRYMQPPGSTWHAWRGQSAGRTATARWASFTSAVMPKKGVPDAAWYLKTLLTSAAKGKGMRSMTLM